MNRKNRTTSLAALMMSALLVTACGNDNTGTPKPPPGGGGAPDAAGFPDATGGNMGMDSGVIADAGPSGPCPVDYPGCRCTPTDPTGMTDADKGSCLIEGSLCVPYSESLAICINQCQSDMDCAGKKVGNPDDDKAAELCRNIGDDGIGICVQSEKQDDERCRLHALAGRKMEGCRSGAQCAALAEDDPPGVGTCVQLCTVNPQNPTGGCTGDLPFCNPNLLGEMRNIGICSDKQRGVGAKCGGGFTKMCDSTFNNGSSNVICFSNDILDPNGNQPLFTTLSPTEGFCVELCDPDLPSCPQTQDPVLGSGVCKNLGTGDQGALGLCSHECNPLDKLRPEAEVISSVPVSACTGDGENGVGTTCFGFPPLTVNSMGGIVGQADVCLSVQTPTVAESAVEALLVMDTSTTALRYNPRPKMGTTPVDCFGTGANGELFTCPAGTYCMNIGSSQTQIAACVRRCSTQSSSVATGQFEVNECEKSTLPDAMGLVCIPMALNSTAALGGAAPGFCADAPN
jgi:hypothetical protein